MIDKIAETLTTTFIMWIATGAARAVIRKCQQKSNSEKPSYTKRQLFKIRLEFYIGLLMAVILIIVPEPQYQFLQIGKRILTVLMLSFTLFGFMCLSESVSPSDKESTSDTDQKGEDEK